MWNPLLKLLFFKHVNGIVESYFVNLDLAKIALSCHFALDLLCYKEEGEVHLHCWYCIVVRHGGHVHRDVYCSLFPSLPLRSPPS